MTQCARCDFRADTLEQHATDAGHPLCGVCNRRSLTVYEAQTCGHCIGQTRADLADIEALYARLPGVLVEGRYPSDAIDRIGASGDEVPVPPALVAAGPAGSGSDVSSRAGNREHAADELPTDPPHWGVLAVFEDDWRHLTGQHPASGPPTVATSVAFLTQHLDRIAQQHSEFDAIAEEIGRLRAHLRAVTGLAEWPERGVACFDCGATLTRDWTDCGLADEWGCHSCGRVYDYASYMLAVHAGLLDRKDTG